MNPYPAARMTAEERLAEVAEILATGILRLRLRHGRARQSSRFGRHCGESSLDCAARQSGHGVTTSNRRAAK